jgi:dTDP-4-amino-4,6-dideoxygalactose transaminase
MDSVEEGLTFQRREAPSKSGARRRHPTRTTVTVPLNDFRAQWKTVGPEVLAAVDRVGASGWYVLGREVERFESALASTWGLPHAVGVGNGLDAIEIGLRCLGIRPGDKVLTTPLSAFATTLAVMRCAGVPVFVDTDASGLLDLDRCRDLLSRDSRIRFAVPVHLYGHCIDLERLEALREEFDLRIVEDCAQAIGARFRGRGVGTVGQVAAVSFYPTKNLGTLGDGGAVVTADDALARRARALRHYGQSADYVHDEAGLNSRLDELHAAVLGDVFLPRLTRWTARRSDIAMRYRSTIRDGAVRPVPVPEGSSSVWHLFPVLCEPGRREAFRAHLSNAGVSTGIHYPRLIPEQKAMLDYGSHEVHGPLANARLLAGGEVSLPIHPFLLEEDMDRVIAAVCAWAG